MRSVIGAGLIGLFCGLLLGAAAWLAIAGESLESYDQIYDQFPSEPRPWLAFNLKTGGWFTQFAFLVVLPPIILVGLATTLVARPDTRRGSITLGTLAGLVMSMVAFATGIGWGPILQTTQLENRQDLLLLGQAASADDASREAVARALVRKYPDLEHIPSEEHGSVLVHKVLADETFGIPVALWLGMIASLICCLLPAVLGCVFSSRLLKQKKQIWKVVLPYIEVSALLSLASVFCVMNFVAKQMGANIIVPPFLWQFALFTSLALAIWFAVKDANWKIRVPLHAAWALALFFYLGEVNQTARTYQVAASLLANNDVEAAAERFERYVNNRADRVNARYHAAVLQALAGNHERYQFHCREFIRRHSRTLSPTLAEQTAKVCLLVPESLDDIQPAIDLIDYAIVEGRGSRNWPYFLMVRGLGFYRQGQFDRVTHWTSQIEANTYPMILPTASLISRMAEYQMASTDESKVALSSAINAARSEIEQYKPTGPLSQFLVDWLYLQVLTREARQLISGQLPTGK